MQYRCEECGSIEDEAMVDEMYEVIPVDKEECSDVRRTYYICKGGCLNGSEEEEV